MKSLLILSLMLLVGCNSQGPSATSTDAPTASPTVTTTPTHTITRTDNNVQHIVYDVVDGGMSYYTSTTTFTDTQTFTIPSTITLNANSIGSIVDTDNYIDIEIVGRIACTYWKSGNSFNFHHCTSYAPSVYWTIQPGDIYTVTDLNADSPAFDAHKVNVVLYSSINTPRNGHINFSYDL